eukprot:2821113-Pleurochrysis_carterae.AAC.8
MADSVWMATGGGGGDNANAVHSSQSPQSSSCIHVQRLHHDLQRLDKVRPAGNVSACEKAQIKSNPRSIMARSPAAFGASSLRRLQSIESGRCVLSPASCLVQICAAARALLLLQCTTLAVRAPSVQDRRCRRWVRAVPCARGYPIKHASIHASSYPKRSAAAIGSYEYP